MVVVAIYLQLYSLLVFLYTNDWLLVMESMMEIEKNMTMTLDFLHSLGLQVNFNKIPVSPTSTIYKGDFRLHSMKSIPSTWQNPDNHQPGACPQDQGNLPGPIYSVIAWTHGNNNGNYFLCKGTYAPPSMVCETFQTPVSQLDELAHNPSRGSGFSRLVGSLPKPNGRVFILSSQTCYSFDFTCLPMWVVCSPERCVCRSMIVSHQLPRTVSSGVCTTLLQNPRTRSHGSDPYGLYQGGGLPQLAREYCVAHTAC